VGALLGIWVVGDFANTPWAFVFWVFVVVAVAAYKSGQLASAAVPYAYFLVGLALVSVATYGISDPNNVWRTALYRTLETLVGVVSATFVYALLWPRHSREEFVAGAGAALNTVRLLLGADARAYTGEALDPNRVVDLRRVFSQQVMGLRALLVSGGRGSAYFRARLGNYQRFLVALTHLFQAFLELQRRRAEEGDLLEGVRPELERLLAAVDAELGILSGVALNRPALPPSDLNAAFGALEATVKALRAQGTFRNASPAAGEAFFGHFAALRLIRDELNLVRELSGELPRVRLPSPSKRKRRPVLPVIDRFWALAGLKAGLSVCLAFLLLKWIHPPGSTGIPLGAWIFSVFGRTSLNTGGTGDLRAFQRVFLTALLGLPVVALLWLLMPFLSDYWAMNVFLFVLCYAFGRVVARSPGFSFGLQIGVLAITTLVALNPQEPVAFSALVDAYLGMMTGIALGTLVGRLLWPVLPQGLLRRNLIFYFEDLRRLLGDPKDQEFILTGTVLLPLEALRAVDNMVLPRCPAGEREALANFIRVAQPLGMQLTALQGVKARPLPAGAENLLREPLAALEAGFDRFLAQLAGCFRRRSAQAAFPDLSAEVEAVESAITRVRDEAILAHEDVETVAHLLELVDRYHTIVERLGSCRDRLAGLRLHHYLGDVAL
jgi:hypothetical protein